MTRYEAFIAKDWREHGLAHLVVVRHRSAASADFGVFLVDIWCLGVKNAFGETDVVESDVQELIQERLPESMRAPIHPTCAKKLIEGAIAYAEGLGFAPHRDFRKARRVLSGLDAASCPMEFTYGRDGRPCYVRGYDDSDERVDRVCAILDARVGPEGYDYEDPGAEDDEDLGRRGELLEWLEGEPAEVPRFYQLAGMIAALRLCPEPAAAVDGIDLLWPKGRAWEDDEEREYFTDLLEDYWDYVGDLLRASIAPEAESADQAIDVWMTELPEEEPWAIVAATMEWATGFLFAVERSPAAWANALRRPELAEHWAMIRWWASLVAPAHRDLINAASQEKPPRNIGLSAIALTRTLWREDAEQS